MSADVIATCTYAYEVMACINTQSKIVSISCWRNHRAPVKNRINRRFIRFSAGCTAVRNADSRGWRTRKKPNWHGDDDDVPLYDIIYFHYTCKYAAISFLFHCYNKYNYSLRFSVVIHSSLASVTLGGHARRIPNDVFRFPRSGASLTRLFLSERRRWLRQQQNRVLCINLGRIFRGRGGLQKFLARIFFFKSSTPIKFELEDTYVRIFSRVSSDGKIDNILIHSICIVFFPYGIFLFS